MLYMQITTTIPLVYLVLWMVDPYDFPSNSWRLVFQIKKQSFVLVH